MCVGVLHALGPKRENRVDIRPFAHEDFYSYISFAFHAIERHRGKFQQRLHRHRHKAKETRNKTKNNENAAECQLPVARGFFFFHDVMRPPGYEAST